MGFNDLKINPLNNSSARGLAISFVFNIPRNEIRVSLQGELLSEDGKFICTLNERTLWKDRMEGSGHGQFIMPVYPGNSERIGSSNNSIQMVGTLDSLAIEHIESVRQINVKKDAVFIVKLSATTLDPRLQIMNNVYISHLRNPSINFPAFAEREVPYDKQVTLVVAPGGNMDYKLYSSGEIRLTIPASDWIHDYQRQLGLGKHVIIESSLPDLESTDLPKNVNEEKKTLAERLQKSYEILVNMQNELNKGEWGNVVEESVKLFELVKKDNAGVIKKLMSESTGLALDKVQSLTEALDKLYGFAAELHHPVDRENKKVKQPFLGEKEDAQMIYFISLSLVNMLSKKLSKSVRNS